MTPNDDLLAALVTHQAHTKRMPAVVMERVKVSKDDGCGLPILLGRAMIAAQSLRPAALVIMPTGVAESTAEDATFDIPCIIDAQELAE